jgi:hypothetical protein
MMRAFPHDYAESSFLQNGKIGRLRRNGVCNRVDADVLSLPKPLTPAG